MECNPYNWPWPTETVAQARLTSLEFREGSRWCFVADDGYRHVVSPAFEDEAAAHEWHKPWKMSWEERERKAAAEQEKSAAALREQATA